MKKRWQVEDLRLGRIGGGGAFIQSKLLENSLLLRP